VNRGDGQIRCHDFPYLRWLKPYLGLHRFTHPVASKLD
jgi:hypothetical protein